MATIDENSGKLLIIFYKRHVEKGYISNRMIRFRHTGGKWKLMNTEPELKNILSETFGENDDDIYRAMKYLKDEKLIDYIPLEAGRDAVFRNSEIKSSGVRMIEGVSKGERFRNQFEVTFNVTVNNDINVDSLFKNQNNLGSVFSMFGLGG